MPDTIHRLLTDLFHRYSGTRPHHVPPTPCRGIPDGYMEKVPPPEERQYTRDDQTQRRIQMLKAQDHAA